MLYNKLLKICSRRLLRDVAVSETNMCIRLYAGAVKQNTAKLFFLDTVQDLLKKLTRLDIEKVYSPRKEGVRCEPPSYKFMTTSEYEKVRKEAEERAQEKLQMPPVLDKREEIDSVFVKDDNLIGFSKCKFVFTDITNGVEDRVRNITVRDEDGTLRQARWDERDRMNQIYFPRPARKITPSKMFNKENIQRLLENGEYIFVLDSACCQFEPDDPMYIDVCHQTYAAVDSDCAYNKLRSTRHYGPFVFYLAQTKKIDNLLTENIATDKLEDAVWLIHLYQIINPDAKSSAKTLVRGKELDFIQNYIVEDSENRDKLELTLQTYREYLEAPKSESINQ